MKKWIFWIGWSCGVAWSHPLDWLPGTYHSLEGASEMRENWVMTPGQGLIGVNTWLEQGRPFLTEVLHILPEGKKYRLEIALHYADGKTKQITMRGGPVGAQQFRFTNPAESLSYEKDAQGHLRVVLTKKKPIVFDLHPGPLLPRQNPAIHGDYRAWTYFSDQPMEDILHLPGAVPGGGALAPPGSLSGGVPGGGALAPPGSLEVPGKWSAALEDVRWDTAEQVRFRVRVPEGEKPFPADYHLRFSPDGEQAVGTLVHGESGKQLASLVLRRRKP